MRSYTPGTIHHIADGRPLQRAIILDTETTGLDLQRDRLMQLSMIDIAFCPQTAQIHHKLGTFDKREDPGIPITAEAMTIHGISAAMVDGKCIDDEEVAAFVADAALVISHNAWFDRQFVERRFPCFERLRWACTLRGIDWRAHFGPGSRSIIAIAEQFGIAAKLAGPSDDCLMLLEILQMRFPATARTPMFELLENMGLHKLRCANSHQGPQPDR